MAVRRFFRGTVEWDRLEGLARELARRYDEPTVRVEFLEADNWLSTPFVLNDRYFVKVVTRQNSLVHALFTGARNLGAFSSGTEGFFEHFSTPVAMAEHELQATERMRDLGVNAPAPVEAFEVDGFGVVVLEFLPAFRPLAELDAGEVEGFAPELFGSLATMHAHGLVHGDLRDENVLVQGGELYFIDATNVRDDGIDRARPYDVACALAVLEPRIGARAAVAAGLEHYDAADLLEAREFLDFVSMRPDHGFDAASVKGEVERVAADRG
ncbi:MAG: protein kinase family protein [Actinobacteria bacterium]|nr:protein kinase family protein [Actinomycetota bacterium]NIU67656.1 protein kinase family protein [Actinomycetota bacterium]NIW29424.1 protein kinase family protein [Actinomycetota bacterium]NIX21939.1 protein kinase family protein [Actinomycetota bacterium]